MSYVMPDEIDKALGCLADHCVVPRAARDRDAVLRAFGTLSRAGRELRDAIEREASQNAA
ncbi:hypothetical protein [Streptomyces sp. NPDC059593]|uniref:hypothetical protein n=1 Tax=Streptomyces sp. NPDC059593 TaxID=3346878 RepID=UPI0036C85EBE